MEICPASQSHQSASSKLQSAKLQSAIRLSVFVCAHNEAANLGACLERLSFADEVVVLLDRSTDGSAAIACALGDRVIEGVFPLEGPRRAAAQAACSGEWVLEVDADEHIPPALAREIRARLDRGEPADWYLVPVNNYVGGRLVRCGWGGSFGTSAVARLYRRGAKSWGNERVHPTTHMAGRYGGRLSYSIDHWVDTDISDMLCRLDRYTAQRAADLQRLPKARHGLLSHLFRGIRRFWKCYVTRRGYREGDWGVLIALMAALYPMLSELRARLEVPGVLSETEPQPIATPTVDEVAA
jgi:glycosyltransferase involved in cell wall biosynthesis